MYACDFDVPWIDHPFLRRRFPVRTAADVARIRATGIHDITIDTDRGGDVAVDDQSGPDPGAALPEAAAAVPTYVSFECELARARRLVPAAHQEMRSLMHDVRRGGAVEVERAAAVVELVTTSVLRNPSALTSLLRIKDKDNYTYLHSLAVCTLLVNFAISLKMDEAQVRKAGIGGLLHDIGKMRVPGEILNKPGPLSAGEFSIMRMHPERGAELLARSRHFDEVAETCARHHHERIDGAGYPDRLRAGDISLTARMTAIVDAYDAITSDRCYHTGLPATAALARMWEYRDTHFDGDLLQAFMRCVGIYPVGALVRLSDERLAVVVQHDPTNLLTPRLRVMYSLRDRRYMAPVDLDLARLPAGDTTRILQHEAPEHWNIRTGEFLG